MRELPRLVVRASAPLGPLPTQAPCDADAFEAWRLPDAPSPFGASWREDGTWIVQLGDAARFRFEPGGETVEAIARPGLTDGVLEDQWLRQVLPLVVQAAGTEVLHASAVDTEHGVIAFSGDAGAGKSTLAWSLSRLGAGLWADDALAFASDADEVRTHFLPFRLRLWPDVLEAAGGHKQVAADVEAREPATRPLRAIVFLAPAEAGEDAEQLTPLATGDAFPALLAQAWGLGLQEPEAQRRLVERYLALAGGVRLLTFRRGRDPAACASTARALWAQLPAALAGG